MNLVVIACSVGYQRTLNFRFLISENGFFIVSSYFYKYLSGLLDLPDFSLTRIIMKS